MIADKSDADDNVFRDDFETDRSHEDECRICRGVYDAGPLISPCHCRGTVGLVHLRCLERWLQSSCRLHCEICNYYFQTVYCRRHTFVESLQTWLRHPLRRQRFKTDVYSLILLTIILGLVVSICAMKVERAYRGERMGLDPTWTITLMSLFLTVIVACYIWSIIYLILRQIIPWYRFWKNTRRVRLALFDMSPETNDKPEIALRPSLITEPIQIALG